MDRLFRAGRPSKKIRSLGEGIHPVSRARPAARRLSPGPGSPKIIASALLMRYRRRSDDARTFGGRSPAHRSPYPLGVGTAVLTAWPRLSSNAPRSGRKASRSTPGVRATAWPVSPVFLAIGPLLASRNGQYSIVGAAESRRDPRQFREWLTRARGYTVLGRDGTRLGAFIELAGPDGERIAIRYDGVFLWRRRVLPITTVANIFPKERAVLLNIDRRTLGGTTAADDAVDGPPPPADEGADPSREWQERIERYISPESEPDQAEAERAGAATSPPAETAGLERERPLTDAARQPMGRGTSDERSAERYLLFLSTSHGYVLVDLEGSPPPLGQKIQVQEQPGSFLVAKLSPSPLPNDPRVCAYLDR
jgi:hypothetical protein